MPRHPVRPKEKPGNYQSHGIRYSEISSLNIHLDNEPETRTIKRWKPGSKLTFNGDPASFPNRWAYQKAMEALTHAAEQWNAIGLSVTFKKVRDGRTAVFSLVYIPDDGHEWGSDRCLLAQSFFPADWTSPNTALYVYQVALSRPYCDNLAAVFCHELGHLLGLRHEDADTDEHGHPCVPFGCPVTASVDFGPHEGGSEARGQGTPTDSV
ncbi:unnamed protein product [Parascedosporium putredinis]|uniref:Peptidase metallopeptidase domain-containing protein n=1 Tax=Parascedosporium putredinis TaxID=1442378 RepID=A0A9P1GYX7_9PEZI|nr:unnamed protein product [Parascedosporium putredinis]CAI7991208.1 unnamed protein product [Parascedosporium putredinis]